MEKLKKILQSETLALGLTPLLFAISQIIIIGYYWFANGYLGDFRPTISRYVGFELWTSILFAFFNFAIAAIMFRYYLSIRKSRSLFWFLCGCVQVATFVLLSIFPHNIFMPEPLQSVVTTIHIHSARLMFGAMCAMTLETLRLSYPNHLKSLSRFRLFRVKSPLHFPKITTKICLFFALYALVYAVIYATKWPFLWDRVFIIESGYIYAFMAFLLLTRKVTPRDK